MFFIFVVLVFIELIILLSLFIFLFMKLSPCKLLLVLYLDMDFLWLDVFSYPERRTSPFLRLRLDHLGHLPFFLLQFIFLIPLILEPFPLLSLSPKFSFHYGLFLRLTAPQVHYHLLGGALSQKVLEYADVPTRGSRLFYHHLLLYVFEVFLLIVGRVYLILARCLLLRKFFLGFGK